MTMWQKHMLWEEINNYGHKKLDYRGLGNFKPFISLKEL